MEDVPLFLVILTSGQWTRTAIHEADANGIWVALPDDESDCDESYIGFVNWSDVNEIRRVD